MFIKMKVIELLEGDVWGCSKDINEYSEVSQHVYDRIKQYQQDGIQKEEIIDKKGERPDPARISFHSLLITTNYSVPVI